MTIDWWTLGLQTVNVLVLVWILARFLFRPVARIIADRQAAASAVLDEAAAAKSAAETARAAAEAERAALAARRGEMIAAAAAEAAAEKDRLLAAAHTEAGQARAAEKAELARLRATEAQALSAEAGTLAADIAGRLLDRLPETARVAGFAEGLARAVADLPEATRAGIGTDGPVRLRAARPLTEAERAELTERLAAVLGQTPELAVEVDPTLIAGIELDAPHAVVRNHFRADLDRIRTELTRHD